MHMPFSAQCASFSAQHAAMQQISLMSACHRSALSGCESCMTCVTGCNSYIHTGADRSTWERSLTACTRGWRSICCARPSTCPKTRTCLTTSCSVRRSRCAHRTLRRCQGRTEMACHEQHVGETQPCPCPPSYDLHARKWPHTDLLCLLCADSSVMAWGTTGWMV